MKKAIVVTSTYKGEDISERLSDVGAKPGSITIFFFNGANEDSLLRRIKKNRPCMVVLDGRMHPDNLVNFAESIRSTLQAFAINSRMYSIHTTESIPGVISATTEHIVERLEEN